MIRPNSRGVKAKIVILILPLMALLITPSCQDTVSRDAAAPGGSAARGSKEQQVCFTSGSDSLAGTLFWPGERAGCPAVVVLAGSDRSQRGPLRTAIAEYFADHGIAALVYDSPGAGASTGNAILQSSADRVAEARSAVAYLKGLDGIRPTAVGLFGGSEGANIALMACAKDPGVAFAIPVSGSLGVSVLDILRYSAEKQGFERGLSADEIAQAMTFKEIAFVLFSGADIVEWSLIATRVNQWEDGSWAELVELVRRHRNGLNPEQKKAFLDAFRRIITHFQVQRWFTIVDVGNSVHRMLSLDADTFFNLLESGRYSSDWERSLCFGPMGIRCPVLAIWGEEDSFLPPHQSAARLRKYLMDSKHPDYEVVIYPNASHFLTTPGSTTDVVPGYLDTMANWVNRRFGSTAPGGLRHTGERTP